MRTHRQHSIIVIPAHVRVLQLLLGGLFCLAGVAKLVPFEAMAERFDAWGYGSTLMQVTGVLEVLGGIALVFPRVGTIASTLLGLVMLGATYTHLFRGFPPMALVPVLVLVLLAYVGYR